MSAKYGRNAQPEPIWVAGCMSGTSLDGVDVAMLRTDGVDIFDFGPSAFHVYRSDEQQLLRSQLGLWEASSEACDLIETAHAQALTSLQTQIETNEDQAPFEMIGFHGQTFAHDPQGGGPVQGTYQAGNGAVLAELFGVPCVWDFRTADVQMGGQGAPLAPFYHHALARYIEATEPVVFLNLGGVGNLTWVDPNVADPADPTALLAFDTGPANAPINDLMMARCGKSFDENGALAASGEVNAAMLERFVAHPYFLKMPPKSLDRNDFHDVLEEVNSLSDADAAATLTAIAATAVMLAVDHCPIAPAQILTCGGGSRNQTLMSMLQAGLDCSVAPVESVGLDGDMLEAQAFAYLAARVKNGLPTSCPTTTGVAGAIGGGRVSQGASWRAC